MTSVFFVLFLLCGAFLMARSLYPDFCEFAGGWGDLAWYIKKSFKENPVNATVCALGIIFFLLFLISMLGGD